MDRRHCCCLENTRSTMMDCTPSMTDVTTRLQPSTSVSSIMRTLQGCEVLCPPSSGFSFQSEPNLWPGTCSEDVHQFSRSNLGSVSLEKSCNECRLSTARTERNPRCNAADGLYPEPESSQTWTGVPERGRTITAEQNLL